MIRKILMASVFTTSTLALAAAAGAGGMSSYSQPHQAGASIYDTPTTTRTMSEGLMAQSSLERMDIRSGEETAFDTSASPGPDIMPTLNADQSGRVADTPELEPQATVSLVQLERATFPVRNFTSTASEGLVHEQLALQERVLFNPVDQVPDTYRHDAGYDATYGRTPR